MSILDKITINAHSSIRIAGESVCYFDPFKITEQTNDAEYVFITHDHYDHLDIDSLRKIINVNTIFVVPNGVRNKLLEMNVPDGQIEAMLPDEKVDVLGLQVEAVAAYNTLKPYHPKMARWLGYVVTLGGQRIYVTGDTDCTDEAMNVQCDIACVPVGGTYTMDASDAAKLVNHIKPKYAIPTHFGCITGKAEDGDEFDRLVDDGIQVVHKIQV